MKDVYSTAFRSLARGLWLILGGWLGMIGGLVVLSPLAIAKGKAIPGEALLMAVGGFLLLSGFCTLLAGKWACGDMHKKLHSHGSLPGHRWLLTSLWCDFGSFSIRWLAAGMAMPQLRLATIPLALVGQFSFLLFLRRTADVIHQPRLKQWCEGLICSTGLVLVLGGFAILFISLRIKVLAALLIGIMGLTLLASLFAYLGLLFGMARAAREFGAYLQDDEDELDQWGDLRVKNATVLEARQPE